ncbi:ATP-binding cassette domain-containing protein [Litorihabitans aurantiacus]|uniref:ABC transporter ATP-binding protein n=1 Tax=Litorihabitans aurantiacus TaxID=1930061 RepID=A0AA38CPX2_9MICO|nr:ABC transporter ATP-binding protein [Litorihabitans aurantiacus]GMA32033.1 ABC transporter ATP-binding protein [Litorihabitans aurantiacus]
MIDISRLSVSIGGRTIVNDATFAVPAGAVSVFVGKNGAGKTTTFRAIAGMLIPRAGTVTIDGRPATANATRADTLGYSLGPSALPAAVPARRFLALVAATAPDQDARRRAYDRALAMAADVEIEPHLRKRIGALSEGTKQKVAVIAALAHAPGNLLLDEPYNGLDPDSMAWLKNRIEERRRAGASVLVSTHLLREAADNASMAVQIADGSTSTVPWPPASTGSVAHRSPSRGSEIALRSVRTLTPEAQRLSTALLAAGRRAEIVQPDEVRTDATIRIVLAVARDAHIHLLDMSERLAPDVPFSRELR